MAISFSIGIYTIKSSCDNYFNFDVITSTTIVKVNNSIFPSIIFCNNKNDSSLLKYLDNCLFNGEKCDLNFFKIYNREPKYKCIRFNEFRENSPLLTTSGIGFKNSLRVDFNMPYPGADIKLYILDNYIEAKTGEMDFYFRGPVYMDFYFSKVVNEKRQAPYNDCKVMNLTYRQMNCLRKCAKRLLIERYNCSLVGFSIMIKTGSCKIRSWKMNHILESLMEECAVSECPKECTEIDYTIGNYPINMVGLEENITTLARICFFFNDLSLVKIHQVPKTTISDLVSSIGGAMGIFLGMSILSILEFWNFVCMIFICLIKRCCN